MKNLHQICLPINTVAQRTNLLTFSDEDKNEVIYPHNESLVISIKIMGALVHQMLVNNGAFDNILLKNTLD